MSLTAREIADQAVAALPHTPVEYIDRAREIALLFGGNGLTGNEQIAVVATRLREHDQRIKGELEAWGARAEPIVFVQHAVD